MITLNLDKNSETPIYLQLFTGIRDMIENGTICAGERLPATRVLAEKHGISRTVVYRAYQELWGQGYLESRPGSYSVVRKKAPNVSMDGRAGRGLIDWDAALTPECREMHDTMGGFPACDVKPEGPDVLNIGMLSLDPDEFPVADFKRCLNQVMHDRKSLFNYGPMEGLPALRKSVAARLQSHSIFVSPEEILITNGTQHSIDLVLRMLVGKGSTIVTETPTYYNVVPLMRFYGARIRGVPMTRCGLDLGAYEEAAREERPALLYTMPNFHNPTGITMCQDHRERVLSISTDHRVPVVEDAFEEEMKYFGKVPLAIKSMDRDHIVIYLSSFSKALFPGLRIGWIAADREFIRRAARVKMASDITSNSVVQGALDEFCRRGYYDLHIKRMHRVYKKRMQTALSELKKRLDFGDVTFHEPLGGYLIWLRLGGLRISEDRLHAIFDRHGLRVPRGSLFFIGKQREHHVRFSISYLTEEKIVEGVSRLQKALKEAYGIRDKG